MPVRPLAAYCLRPVHKTVVRKNTEAEIITLLTEGEPLSVRAMRKPMKVLKGGAVSENTKPGLPEPSSST